MTRLAEEDILELVIMTLILRDDIPLAYIRDNPKFLDAVKEKNYDFLNWVLRFANINNLSLCIIANKDRIINPMPYEREAIH